MNWSQRSALTMTFQPHTAANRDRHRRNTSPRIDAAGTHTFLTDDLGGTAALIGPTSTDSTRYAYEPFGRTTITSPGPPTAYQYTGRENDDNDLYYYYRARYYNPAHNRFISEDPIDFAAGDLNLYAYTSNDPINHIDPSGLAARKPGDSFAGPVLVLFLEGLTLTQDSKRETMSETPERIEDVQKANAKLENPPEAPTSRAASHARRNRTSVSGSPGSMPAASDAPHAPASEN